MNMSDWLSCVVALTVLARKALSVGAVSGAEYCGKRRKRRKREAM